jgi:KaiC/GvpD/RAD55 family RecA-like ATPase
MKLIKTGIAGLDEFLLGGFTPGAYLILGSPESGTEVFARQIAYSRAKQTNITYFSIAKVPEIVKEDMSTYGWETSKMEKEGKWKFIKPSAPSRSFIYNVTDEIRQNRCIIIDSLSELLLTYSQEEMVEFLNSISTMNIEQQDLHLILMTKGMQNPIVEITAQHFADGVIELDTSWETEVSAKSIMFKKMKGAIVPTRRLPYSIGKNGFTIETAIRIT